MPEQIDGVYTPFDLLTGFGRIHKRLLGAFLGAFASLNHLCAKALSFFTSDVY